MQKDSYDWFIEEGLGEVLKDIVSIRNLKANNKITKEALIKIIINKEEFIPIYKQQLKIADDKIISEEKENLTATSYK